MTTYTLNTEGESILSGLKISYGVKTEAEVLIKVLALASMAQRYTDKRGVVTFLFNGDEIPVYVR